MRSQIHRHLAGLFASDMPRPALFATAALAEAPFRQKPGTELPRDFSWHDYAVYLLHVAAEIEHSLMVQYLYAAYSLGGPDVPPDRQSDVLRWQNSILGIAKEEMGHFLTVQNILRLIGGVLNLERDDFPWNIPFYPYPFELEPLTRTSLAKYIFAEAPDEWPSDLTAAERTEIEAAVHMRPQDMAHRVGELYDLMIGVLSEPNALPDSLFHEETVPFQASWDEWGRGQDGTRRGPSPEDPSPNVILRQLSSRSDAVAALTAIARQGEAPDEAPAAQELSHFRRFLKIFRQFPQADAKWSPTWRIPNNPQAPGLATTSGGPAIQHPEAALWGILFNLRYRMLLAYLAHSFRLSAEPMETGASNPRSLVINRTFTEMYNLRSMAGILVQLPLDDEASPLRAGPPFQTPYTTNLPPAEADCWRVHLDLIDAARSLLTELTVVAGGKRAEYAVVLQAADQQARSQIELLVGATRSNTESQPHRRSIAI